jgi:hypothetical protein
MSFPRKRKRNAKKSSQTEILRFFHPIRKDTHMSIRLAAAAALVATFGASIAFAGPMPVKPLLPETVQIETVAECRMVKIDPSCWGDLCQTRRQCSPSFNERVVRGWPRRPGFAGVR